MITESPDVRSISQLRTAASAECANPKIRDPCIHRMLNSREVIQFEQQGFLRMTAFASPAAIAHVRTIIDGLYALDRREVGPSDNLLHRAPELKESSVFRACAAIAKQLLGRSSSYAFDQALYKEPHGRNGTPWHQDGAFHGQFPNRTIGFWIPLQDEGRDRQATTEI